MTKARLEAFSDGVLAIIITIMVLELKVPHEPTMEALFELSTVFISYLLSFVFIAIYWGNHHHLMHTVHHVNSPIIWANMGLLFTLSLIPFTTAWMGENHFDRIPLAAYGFNMLCCAIAYFILQKTIEGHYTNSTKLTEALKKQQKKGMLSLSMYVASVASALVFPWISGLLIVAVAVLWIIPDKNIERALKE